SPESLRAAVAERRGVYYSRSRQALWRKGESSGDTQDLLRIDIDCDRDALRFTVRQRGRGFCHTGARTCFGDSRGLHALARRLAQPPESRDPASYTSRLLRDPALLASKLREEAAELCDAQAPDDIAHEAADVLYFTLARLAAAGVSLDAVERELDRRALKVSRRPGDAKMQHGEHGEHAGRNTEANTPAPASTPCPPAPAVLKRGAAHTNRLLRTVQPSDVPTLRRTAIDPETLTAASAIVGDVRRRGEPAVRFHAERLGDVADGAPLVIDRAELARALDAIDREDRAVLERAAARIRAFADAQRASLLGLVLPIPGGQAGHWIAPVERAGCYAPGGRYPLPSSVLMTAVTARAAGVREVFVASPRPTPITLAASAIAGADALLAVGGAQAIAALAYGCPPLPPCDIVVGPGNRYVTAAKQLVAGHVAIDMLAGPSELLVIADDSADPAVVAADLLAQAEHDTDACAVLVSTSADLLEAVERELAAQLQTLSTAATARAALANGYAVVACDIDEAIALADRFAPEHLEILTRDADAIARRCAHYGAAFVGLGAAEVLGDYGVGPNHTLPTGGTARSGAGLSVLHFLRTRTWLSIDDPAQARELYRDTTHLARLEGLEAHARSAERRLQ
ncbi:MAG TPA: histidinol dehydrogenase, partial [Phycisphaerales bacterium]|nr:histidinol dehydrogenase [Phycisphaerales bacterium]